MLKPPETKLYDIHSDETTPREKEEHSNIPKPVGVTRRGKLDEEESAKEKLSPQTIKENKGRGQTQTHTEGDPSQLPYIPKW